MRDILTGKITLVYKGMKTMTSSSTLVETFLAYLVKPSAIASLHSCVKKITNKQY